MELLKTHPMEQPKEYSKEMESTWNPPKTLGKRLLELPGLYLAAKNSKLLSQNCLWL